MTTVLVLGGYGGFGTRLSRRLAAGGHRVIVTGRSLAKATAFCRDVPGCIPAQGDRTGDLAALLTAYRPMILVDAAGPFQHGGDHVVRACIAAGVHYLDLADGRAFVSRIGTLDEDARAGGVIVLSGASSVPALSGAVLRTLATGLEHVSAVEMAISASNRAAAGASVAAAILSYVGRPIAVWRGRRWSTGHGWQEIERAPFALAGTTLGHRLVALADVPDLALLPDRLPGRPAVVFRAGTELWIQNVALWLASWPVRWGWLRSLTGAAALLLPLQRLTARLGSDRSGMVVRLFGLASGKRVERRWTLIADKGDGPEIPTLAAAVLVDRIAAGKIAPGARDAGEILSLVAFEPAFAGLAIRHETLEIAQGPSLYARVMQAEFAALAPAVQATHGVLRDGGAAGHATVTRGRNPFAQIVASVMRFPATGEHDLHVDFRERDGRELWRRNFSGRVFTSVLSQHGAQLVERFGPFRFGFTLPVHDAGLTMLLRRWSAFGVPLPLVLAPRTAAHEWEEDRLFRFDVSIALPLVGLIVRYRGSLSPP